MNAVAMLGPTVGGFFIASVGITAALRIRSIYRRTTMWWTSVSLHKPPSWNYARN